MKAPNVDLSSFLPMFGWQEINEIVYLRCPNGHVSRLDHGIDEKGICNPSVQCPKCAFHESNLVLDDY